MLHWKIISLFIVSSAVFQWKYMKMTFLKCLPIWCGQHVWPGMLRDVDTEYPATWKAGWTYHSGYHRTFHWHHFFSPPRHKSSCIPPPPTHTHYLRLGWVEAGFTFFSQLKGREGPPGRQSSLSHIQALQCFSILYHMALNAHFTMQSMYCQKKKQLKNTSLWYLLEYEKL